MKSRWTIAAYLLLGSPLACQPEEPQTEDAPSAVTSADVVDADTTAGTLDVAAQALMQAEATERLTEIEASVQELPGLIASVRQDMRRHLNAVHVAAARRNGVGPVRDRAHVTALVRSGQLVELPESTRWWVLRELNQSLPYVTPDTRAALEEVGRRFHARLEERGLPPFRLDVTSVLRTGGQQAALRGRNPNASETTSSHEFGTTLDIAYLSFAAPQALDHASLGAAARQPLPEPLRADLTTRLDSLAVRHAPHLEGELGAVLQELQREGAVLPLRERSQPVFHITVARAPR